MLLVNGGVLMVLPLKGTPWALVPSLRKVGQAVCVYLCSPHKKERHTLVYEETRLTVSGLLIEKVPQSEEDHEYCMRSLGNRGRVESGVFWPIPQHALLQRHSADLYDSASERESDGSDRVPVSLVFCRGTLRVYVHACTGSLTTVAMVTAYFMHQSQRASWDRKLNECSTLKICLHSGHAVS